MNDEHAKLLAKKLGVEWQPGDTATSMLKRVTEDKAGDRPERPVKPFYVPNPHTAEMVKRAKAKEAGENPEEAAE